LNPRDKHKLKTRVGRVFAAGTNSIYNQRLETYYFQSAAARSCKTLPAMWRSYYDTVWRSTKLLLHKTGMLKTD